VKKHVVIAVPAYAGTVHLGFMRSILSDVLTIAKRGDALSIIDECHGAEIDTVRAQIVAEFMASKGTHLVMVDSDLCWSAGGITRLVDHGKDFVCGAYPHRKDPITWPMHLLPGPQVLVDGLLEVKAAPGGFVCLSRQALERMIAEFANLKFKSSKTDLPIWALFDHVHDDGMRLSEDLSFCHRWRSIGGKIWLDPSITVGHIGPKLFMGKFGEVDGNG
jgi:hypothetical protein